MKQAPGARSANKPSATLYSHYLDITRTAWLKSGTTVQALKILTLGKFYNVIFLEGLCISSRFGPSKACF